MNDLAVLLIAVALVSSIWCNIFQFVLAHERTQLAPARSGGGTSSAAGLAPSGPPALPTPR